MEVTVGRTTVVLESELPGGTKGAPPPTTLPVQMESLTRAKATATFRLREVRDPRFSLSGVTQIGSGHSEVAVLHYAAPNREAWLKVIERPLRPDGLESKFGIYGALMEAAEVRGRICAVVTSSLLDRERNPLVSRPIRCVAFETGGVLIVIRSYGITRDQLLAVAEGFED